MGVFFIEPDYVEVLESSGLGEPVPQRFRHGGSVTSPSDYVVYRGKEYLLVFPKASTMTLRLQFLREDMDMTPEPACLAYGQVLMGLTDELTFGLPRKLSTFEDYVQFSVDDSNTLQLYFECLEMNLSEDWTQNYYYSLNIEGVLGNTSINKIIRFFVKQD
jgi:hypothetical protein